MLRPDFPSPASGLSRRDALRFLGAAGLAAAVGARPLAAQPITVVASPKPTLAGEQPAFYRFKVGSIEAIAFLDGGFAAPPEQSPFAAGLDRALVAPALAAAALRTDRVEVTFGILLFDLGGERVLVDAGCGSAFGPAGGHLTRQLALAGVDPSSITGIVLTHAHGDHFGGLLDAEGRPAFPNAVLFVNKRERDFWTASSPDMGTSPLPAAMRDGVIASAKGWFGHKDLRFMAVEPGAKLIEGMELVDAPGHTPGHLAVLLSSGNEQLLHVVDAVHHHALSFANPEWPFLYDTDPVAAAATRRKLLDRAAADNLRVFGAHMPFPGLGRVRGRAEGGYSWIAEPWSPVGAG